MERQRELWCIWEPCVGERIYGNERLRTANIIRTPLRGRESGQLDKEWRGGQLGKGWRGE
jgi:hypothetical protein